MSISKKSKLDNDAQLQAPTANGAPGDMSPSGRPKRRMAGWTPLKAAVRDDLPASAVTVLAEMMPEPALSSPLEEQVGAGVESSLQGGAPRKECISGHTAITGPSQTLVSDSSTPRALSEQPEAFLLQDVVET